MADGGYNDRDRGRRRRRRGGRRDWQERDYDREEDPYYSSQPPTRHPIILAKPQRPASRDSPSLSGDDLAHSPRSDPLEPADPVHPAPGSSPVRPMVVLRSGTGRQGDGEGSQASQFVTSAAQSIPAMLAGESLPQQVYQVQQRRSSASTNQTGSEGGEKLSMPQEMRHRVQLVDEAFMWTETGTEVLLDQTDFLVVGVLGLQGVGKSTLLSHIAGNTCLDSPRNLAFPAQSRETREVCAHQTMGVDMFVTPERTILLDTQPVLSASILDQLIHQDNKYPAEYTSTENCIEMQSLQLAAFLLTVCNIVVVVMEGFADVNIFRFLQTAEMLKPSTPQAHDSPSEDSPEVYPHIVFAVNHAEREDFTMGSYTTMQATISRLMHQSKLKFKGPCNMSTGQLISGLHPDTTEDCVNLYLLPPKSAAPQQDQQDGMLSFWSEYQGHQGFEAIMDSLTQKVLSMPRHLLTHTTLSEKNWFHYAARTWDAVKKSSLMSEYNRLLP